MNREQATKVASDFAYLIGKTIDFPPTKPTIYSIEVEEYDGQCYVRLYAENPHPSICNAFNIFLHTYCKEAGIEYTFPA
jgi:hypothetical protein